MIEGAYDPEAGVWYVLSSDVPGVNAEAASLEELEIKAAGAAADLLSEPSEHGF